MSNEESRTPMWTHQWVFQPWVSTTVLETFNCLDEKLSPRFFIVGIPRDEKRAVCVEPPDEYGYNPEFFNDIDTLAREIEANEAAKRRPR